MSPRLPFRNRPAICPSFRHLIGMIIMVFAGIFVAIALGILVLAKVVLWVLLGTAPIFISCIFFNVTRNYAMGWINQCLLYAMIPLFVYVIAAFLIAAMEPELTKIDQISGNRELKLSDFAAFIMLCIAGSFVLFQVQSLAQGIVGGLGDAQSVRDSRRCAYQGDFLEPRGDRPVGTTDAGCGPSRPGEAAVATQPTAAGTAMQRTITSNGTPRQAVSGTNDDGSTRMRNGHEWPRAPKSHCAPISSRATSGSRRSSSGPSARRASPGSSRSSSPGLAAAQPARRRPDAAAEELRALCRHGRSDDRLHRGASPA